MLRATPSGMPLANRMNEADYLGAMLGRAIEIVRCRTTWKPQQARKS